jgi:hypothetical protein
LAITSPSYKRYAHPKCSVCGRKFGSIEECDEHIKLTHPQLAAVQARVVRSGKVFLVAVVLLGALFLVPSQFGAVIYLNLWLLPAFIGLWLVGLPAILAPPIVASRGFRRQWIEEHPDDAEKVAAENMAKKEESAEEKREMREAYKASRRYAMRTVVPLLLGFIPLIFIDGALGLSGAIGGGTFLLYLALYFIVETLLRRRARRKYRR